MARKGIESIEEYVAAVKRLAVKKMGLSAADADWLFSQPMIWPTVLAAFNERQPPAGAWQALCGGLASAWIKHNRGG